MASAANISASHHYIAPVAYVDLCMATTGPVATPAWCPQGAGVWTAASRFAPVGLQYRRLDTGQEVMWKPLGGFAFSNREIPRVGEMLEQALGTRY